MLRVGGYCSGGIESEGLGEVMVVSSVTTGFYCIQELRTCIYSDYLML